MFLQSFVSYDALLSLMKYIFQLFIQTGHKTNCIRGNYDIYGKTSKIEEGIILPSFQELQTCRDTFYRIFFSAFSLFVSLYFMIFISMALVTLMIMSTLTTLMLFPQDIPDILLFPLMADLANLAIRNGTPFARSIFNVQYIFFYSIHILMLITEAYD